MDNQLEITATQKGAPASGWVLLFIVAFVQVLSALFLLIGRGPQLFEDDTGVAWSELVDVYPTVALQFSMAQQASLISTLGIGLLCLVIILVPFREGQRWAWYTMWILPASMLPGIVSLARTDNQWPIALFGAAIILLAVIGLLISYRTIFQK